MPARIARTLVSAANISGAQKLGVAASLPHDEAGVPLIAVECRQHHANHHQADNEPRIKQYPGSYHFISFRSKTGGKRTPVFGGRN
jgi:hypothetical protein